MNRKSDRHHKIHVVLSEEVHQRLRIRCAIDGTTIQTYVQRLIEESVAVIELPEGLTAGVSEGRDGAQ